MEGMSWILMQPADDPALKAATKKFQNSGACILDLTKSGAHLLPVAFGPIRCTTMERKYHSFFEKAACG